VGEEERRRGGGGEEEEWILSCLHSQYWDTDCFFFPQSIRIHTNNNKEKGFFLGDLAKE